jgi:hypothetical protein
LKDELRRRMPTRFVDATKRDIPRLGNRKYVWKSLDYLDPVRSGLESGKEAPIPRSVKIALQIDAKLYRELVSVTKENGQSQRFVLERALEHYLHNVVPSQRLVRPEVMAAYRRSNEKYRELYKKLAR